MNRLGVNFAGLGLVPVHTDEEYEFETEPPRRIGDAAVIIVNGRREKVRLLSSIDMAKNARYLVRLPA